MKTSRTGLSMARHRREQGKKKLIVAMDDTLRVTSASKFSMKSHDNLKRLLFPTTRMSN